MIVLAGETNYQQAVKNQLARLGHVEESIAVGLVAAAMKTSSKDGLHRWITHNQAVSVDIEDLLNRSPTSYSEWVARLKTVDENTGGQWYLHDFRVFSFWDSFVALVETAQVLAIFEDNEDLYLNAVRNYVEPKLPKTAIILKKRPTTNEIKNLLAASK
jgi:hypothetical protein